MGFFKFTLPHTSSYSNHATTGEESYNSESRICWWLEQDLGPRRSRRNFLAMPQNFLLPWAGYPYAGLHWHYRHSSKSLTPEGAAQLQTLCEILCQPKPADRKITAASSGKQGKS